MNVLRFTFGAAGCILTCPLLGPGALTVVDGAVVGYGAGKLIGHQKLDRKKADGIDPTLPENPFKDKNWEDIGHTKAKTNGRHKFRNKTTGEILEYDEAKYGEFGHKGHSHYHRPNPKKTGDHNKYLDAERKPIGKHHEKSHLYHLDQV